MLHGLKMVAGMTCCVCNEDQNEPRKPPSLSDLYGGWTCCSTQERAQAMVPSQSSEGEDSLTDSAG
jgi:hypothetical protein